MKKISTAIIICIGDELLIGQTIDTNSAWIGMQLNQLGIQVIRKYIIADVPGEIVAAVAQAQREADLVIISGGLGPTKDDITKITLTEYFGGRLVRNEVVYRHVQKFFETRNRPMLPVSELQADVPDNCTILFNRIGTAPGMLFQSEDSWVASLPGVPNEVKTILTEELLPRVKETLGNEQVIVHKTMLLFGRGESFVAKDIEDIENSLPAHLHLAYLPNYSELRLRLTGIGQDRLSLAAEIDVYYRMMADRLKPYVVIEEDRTIQDAMIQLLKEIRSTVSTAESCTGGLVGSMLTEVPGSSVVYQGSMVAYANDVKSSVIGVDKEVLKRDGAVSEAVVIQMAEKVRQRLGTDFCVSISGILGPGGGTEEKPVGTVWMAVAGTKGTTARLFYFYMDRLTNKELVAKTALNFLRTEIVNHYK
ncbi:MAG: CinA family nicotinamide mononucleotide deamidase-related protein [Taibaiella sp.]|nr:CinA family nicotinamide mononucleotide deamidase-related protein [Taibaiella sp.]